MCVLSSGQQIPRRLEAQLFTQDLLSTVNYASVIVVFVFSIYSQEIIKQKRKTYNLSVC